MISEAPATITYIKMYVSFCFVPSKMSQPKIEWGADNLTMKF